MSSCRVFLYAETQARIRARLGMMPDAEQWRHVTDARDLDTLIERMRENGLPYWVQAMPRAPDTHIIERHLQRRLMEFSRELAKLLPKHWRATGRVLETGGNLVFLRQVLGDEQQTLPDDLDAALLEIAALPVQQRRSALRISGYGRYISQPEPWQNWWQDLQRATPRLRQYEQRKLDRVLSTIRQHLHNIHSAPSETAGHLDMQWQWRNDLEQALRLLLCGDPFHSGLVAIYGVLKLLQFERCRALLICLSRGWQAPDILGHTELTNKLSMVR